MSDQLREVAAEAGRNAAGKIIEQNTETWATALLFLFVLFVMAVSIILLRYALSGRGGRYYPIDRKWKKDMEKRMSSAEDRVTDLEE